MEIVLEDELNNLFTQYSYKSDLFSAVFDSPPIPVEMNTYLMKPDYVILESYRWHTHSLSQNSGSKLDYIEFFLNTLPVNIDVISFNKHWINLGSMHLLNRLKNFTVTDNFTLYAQCAYIHSSMHGGSCILVRSGIELGVREDRKKYLIRN